MRARRELNSQSGIDDRSLALYDERGCRPARGITYRIFT